MAKYDQGGGCACGLQRGCDCGSGQADGTKCDWLPVLWTPTSYGCCVRDKYGNRVVHCFDAREM
jgi:hypothetical protein